MPSTPPPATELGSSVWQAENTTADLLVRIAAVMFDEIEEGSCCSILLTLSFIVQHLSSRRLLCFSGRITPTVKFIQLRSICLLHLCRCLRPLVVSASVSCRSARMYWHGGFYGASLHIRACGRGALLLDGGSRGSGPTLSSSTTPSRLPHLWKENWELGCSFSAGCRRAAYRWEEQGNALQSPSPWKVCAQSQSPVQETWLSSG